MQHNALVRLRRKKLALLSVDEQLPAIPSVHFAATSWGGHNGTVFAGGDLTLSFWMRLSGAPTSGTYLPLWARSSWSVGLLSGGVRFYAMSAGNAQWTVAYPTEGEWHHWLATYTVTTGWTVWLDGVESTPASATGTAAALGTTTWFSTNAYAATTYPSGPNLAWSYELAELGIWNAILDGDTVAPEHYNSGRPINLAESADGASLLRHWRFRAADTVPDEAGAADLTLANATLVDDAFDGPDAWEGVTLTGQSLAVGESGSGGALNPYPPADVYPLLDDGSVVRSYDADERPQVSMLYTLAHLRPSRRYVLQNWAVNGTAYSGLAQGTAPYDAGIAGLGTMASLAAARGMQGSLRHLPIVTIHGENDELAANASYDDDLVTWQADWDADARAATGQAEAIPMIVSQMSRMPSFPSVARIAMQQWAACKANPSLLILAGPKYQYGYTDAYHPDSAGNEALGAKLGQVLATLAAGGTWTPLSPASVTAVGTTITLALNVPVGPVVLDTSTLTAATNYGFEVSDDGGAAITDVSVTGDAEITITLDQVLTTNPRLRYVYTAASAAEYHGNVRDSDATDLGPHVPETAAWNWLVHFDEAIEVSA